MFHFFKFSKKPIIVSFSVNENLKFDAEIVTSKDGAESSQSDEEFESLPNIPLNPEEKSPNSLDVISTMDKNYQSLPGRGKEVQRH
jgi:hypothetical protein